MTDLSIVARRAAKSIALRIPPLARLIRQRDELLAREGLIPPGQQSEAFANFRSASYRGMTKAEIERDMNARYETGNAYPETRRWGHFHHVDLEKTMAAMIAAHAAGKEILELGSGIGGVAPHNVRDAKSIIGTDLSEAALQVARDFFKDRPEMSFRRMDAEEMDLDDHSVDIVVAKEVVEHLLNPERCISEVRRVLRPGGIFVMSSPNRDSFHLRIARKLGLAEFMCSGDHIKEFTFAEMAAMLTEAGFTITQTAGATFTPFTVPGAFSREIEALMADEEFMEWMRALGRKVGAEFAFCYIIAARATTAP